METNFRQDFIRGIRIGSGLLATLAIGWAGVSFAAAAWWALPNVSSGTTLSSTAWNDVVSQVNDLASIMKVDASGHVGFWWTPGITGWSPWAGHKIFELTGFGIDSSTSDPVLSLTNNRPTPNAWDQLWAIIFWSEADQGGIHAAITSYARGTGGPNGLGASLEFHTKGDNTYPHQTRMLITQSWSVGIGTQTPQSALQVVGNYVQIPNYSGSAPLANDCDQASEAGRMAIYTPNTAAPATSYLYICPQGGGWVAK